MIFFLFNTHPTTIATTTLNTSVDYVRSNFVFPKERVIRRLHVWFACNLNILSLIMNKNYGMHNGIHKHIRTISAIIFFFFKQWTIYFNNELSVFWWTKSWKRRIENDWNERLSISLLALFFSLFTSFLSVYPSCCVLLKLRLRWTRSSSSSSKFCVSLVFRMILLLWL